MIVENRLYPSAEAIASFADISDKRIVMINLLKFRPWAAYPDRRESDPTGREAYGRYDDAMQKIITREGGRVLYGETWDMAALVEYPSAAAFARVASSPEDAAIAVHRAAGLAGQLLIRAAPA